MLSLSSCCKLSPSLICLASNAVPLISPYGASLSPCCSYGLLLISPFPSFPMIFLDFPTMISIDFLHAFHLLPAKVVPWFYLAMPMLSPKGIFRLPFVASVPSPHSILVICDLPKRLAMVSHTMTIVSCMVFLSKLMINWCYPHVLLYGFHGIRVHSFGFSIIWCQPLPKLFLWSCCKFSLSLEHDSPWTPCHLSLCLRQCLHLKGCYEAQRQNQVLNMQAAGSQNPPQNNHSCW